MERMNLQRLCASCGRKRRVTWVRGALRCDECRRAMWDTTSVKAPRPTRAVTIEAGGTTYRFGSKAEARRTLRRVLKRKRLPPEVAAQLS